MDKQKQVIRIDASALKESGCMLAFKRIVVDGYKTSLPYNDVLYGSAFHKFISEMYLTKGDFSSAIKIATEMFRKPVEIRKKHLTEKHLIKTCLDYWEHFRATDDFEVLEVNGKPLVEVTFELKIYEDDYVIILLVGTIDKIGKFKNGCYAIGDYKTSSAWNPVSFFKRYDLSTQLITYFFGARELAKQNPDSPLGKVFKSTVGVFIDGIFLSAAETKFQRSEVMYPSVQLLDEYNMLLMRKCIRLADAVRYEPIREGIITGACVEHQFECPFIHVCAAPDKISADAMLKRDFVQKPYNPFKFNDEYY